MREIIKIEFAYYSMGECFVDDWSFRFQLLQMHFRTKYWRDENMYNTIL